jgi:heme-degrading monooxygenase HmoA
MVLEQVEIAVRDGLQPAFEAALCEVRQRVFMSAGFRGLTVAQGADDPSTYVVQVMWETPEELADFTASRAARCWEPVEGFLARSLRVRHFVERPGLGLVGPGVVTDMAWLSE